MSFYFSFELAEEEAAYLAVKEQAEKLGMPSDWKNDLLVHDRKVLFKRFFPFVWAVRPTGTNVYLPEKKECDGIIKADVESCMNRHYFIVRPSDGRTHVREVAGQVALDWYLEAAHYSKNAREKGYRV